MTVAQEPMQGGPGKTKRARRPLKTRLRVYSRAVTDISLVLLWLPATFSGVILWDGLGIVPESPGKGEKIMLWGLTTNAWGEIHWWISAAAVIATLLHFVLDWKAFKGAMKYLVRSHGMPE